MKYSDEELHGRVVLSGDGLAIGEITKLFIDPADWRVEAIQVKLRKEIAERVGASRSIFHAATIEIPAHLIQSVGDAVLLNVPIDNLRAPPAPQPSDTAPIH
jgi:sporulation protein YlmC with PRC-barrel domain